MGAAITLTSTGDFKRTYKFLEKISSGQYLRVLNKYGQMGVQALANATPVKSGKTASSWSYEIEQNDGSYSIVWKNSNRNKNVNIAIILQYGHGTGTGGYVRGIDYINPAIRPIFEEMADSVWQEVTNS